ncbi:P-loop NTPase family protein [Paracoccus rhizosphaerae]|uniref:ATP-binding cassette, subfamily F, member 3 n=1 Tax=Paracoccus rhizosphaerae TaxID=1133347 RepID=A0ABV6CNI0_9RHOB|nr:hypothetical protein [Paracoccus rhizosphaerae]
MLLILDEPTNDLDLDRIAALEAALAGYDAAVLAVRHDEAFAAAMNMTGRLVFMASGPLAIPLMYMR